MIWVVPLSARDLSTPRLTPVIPLCAFGVRQSSDGEVPP